MTLEEEPCTEQHIAMNGVASVHLPAPPPHSSDTQPNPTVAAAAAAATAAAAAAGAAVQHCFSEEVLDTAVHFQVMDLGRQLYIWVGTSAAQMGSLCFASPLQPLTGPGRSMPPVATLVRGANEGGSASVAQRLAARVGRPVAVAWSLPEEPPSLGLVAERRLMRELQTLRLAA